MKNKKGAIGMVVFFVILSVILIVGFIAALSTGIFGYVSTAVTPIITNIGVVGDTNFSQATSTTITPINNFVQALPWLVGIGYVFALVFSVIFAISYTYNPNPVFMGIYVMLVILLIFVSIIISNMYEQIYTGTDIIAQQLQGETLMTYMILFSPYILSIIALLTGVILFVSKGNAGGGI